MAASCLQFSLWTESHTTQQSNKKLKKIKNKNDGLSSLGSSFSFSPQVSEKFEDLNEYISNNFSLVTDWLYISNSFFLMVSDSDCGIKWTLLHIYRTFDESTNISKNEIGLHLPFAASPSTKFKLWLSSFVKFDLELKRRIRASRPSESGFIVCSKPTFNNMNAKFVGCSKGGCDTSFRVCS